MAQITCIVLASASVILFLLSIMMLVQTAAALLASPAAPLDFTERPTAAILVPAHNEEIQLGQTLLALRGQLRAGDRIMVVVDNCTDATAAIARDAGVEVVVRSDDSLVGKGYAIDFGVRQLAKAPPGIVVIIDADCQLHAKSLDILVSTCGVVGRPTQALYIMKVPSGANIMARLSEFGWIIKNHVRPRGMHALGAPCQLMGSGMAVPWSMLFNLPLANADLVEDLKLGLDLAQRGFAPVFCEQALVTSIFPEREEARRAQTMRWEQGRIGTILRRAPRLLWRSILARDWRLGVLALDLCIPSIALLEFAHITVLLLSYLSTIVGVSVWPVLISLAGLATLCTSVAISWRQFGRANLSLLELVIAPVLILSKLSLYLEIARTTESKWVRTERSRID